MTAGKGKKKTMAKAIREHCKKCAGGPKAVRECSAPSCGFYPYRFGTNPARSGIGGRKSAQG